MVLDEDEIRSAIKNTPKETLASQIRPYLPLIDEQMRSEGKRLRTIVKELSAKGLDIKESTLRTYLRRWREKSQHSVLCNTKPKSVLHNTKDQKTIGGSTSKDNLEPAKTGKNQQKIFNKSDLKQSRETFDERFDLSELEELGKNTDVWGDQ